MLSFCCEENISQAEVPLFRRVYLWRHWAARKQYHRGYGMCEADRRAGRSFWLAGRRCQVLLHTKSVFCQSIRYLIHKIGYCFTNTHLINVKPLQSIVQYVLHLSCKGFVNLWRIDVEATKLTATPKILDISIEQVMVDEYSLQVSWRNSINWLWTSSRVAIIYWFPLNSSEIFSGPG